MKGKYLQRVLLLICFCILCFNSIGKSSAQTTNKKKSPLKTKDDFDINYGHETVGCRPTAEGLPKVDTEEFLNIHFAKSCRLSGDETNMHPDVYAFGEVHTDVDKLKWRGRVLAKMVLDLVGNKKKEVVFIIEGMHENLEKKVNNDVLEKVKLLNDVFYTKIKDHEILNRVTFKSWERSEVQKRGQELLERYQELHQKSVDLLNRTNNLTFPMDEDDILKLQKEVSSFQRSVNLAWVFIQIFSAKNHDIRNEDSATALAKALKDCHENTDKKFIVIAGKLHFESSENSHIPKILEENPHGIKIIIPQGSKGNQEVPSGEGLWFYINSIDENLNQIIKNTNNATASFRDPPT